MKIMTSDGEIEMYFPLYAPSAFYTHTVNIVQVFFSVVCLLIITNSLKLSSITAYTKKMLKLGWQQVQVWSSHQRE